MPCTRHFGQGEAQRQYEAINVAVANVSMIAGQITPSRNNIPKTEGPKWMRKQSHAPAKPPTAENIEQDHADQEKTAPT